MEGAQSAAVNLNPMNGMLDLHIYHLRQLAYQELSCILNGQVPHRNILVFRPDPNSVTLDGS